jgi:hypothetical protein
MEKKSTVPHPAHEKLLRQPITPESLPPSTERLACLRREEPTAQALVTSFGDFSDFHVSFGGKEMAGKTSPFEIIPERVTMSVPKIGARWDTKTVMSNEVPPEQRERYGLAGFTDGIDPALGEPHQVRTYPFLHKDRETISAERTRIALGDSFSSEDIPDLLQEITSVCGGELAEELPRFAVLCGVWSRELATLAEERHDERLAVLAKRIGQYQESLSGNDENAEVPDEKTSKDIEGRINQLRKKFEDEPPSDEDIEKLHARILEHGLWRLATTEAEKQMVERTDLVDTIMAQNFNTLDIYDRLKEWFPRGFKPELGTFEEAAAKYREEKTALRELEEALEHARSASPAEVATLEDEYKERIAAFSEFQMDAAEAINAVVLSPHFFRYRLQGDTLDSIATERYVNCYARQRMIHAIWKEAFGETLLHGSKGTSLHKFPLLHRADGRIVSLDFAVEVLEEGIEVNPLKVQHSIAYEGVCKQAGTLHGTPTALVIGEQAEITEFSKYLWEAIQNSNAGNLDVARKLYEKALSLCPEHPKHRYEYALVLDKMGLPAGAEEAFLQAIAHDPYDPQWKEGYLAFLGRAERTDDAEAYLRKLVTETPTEARWRNALGRLLERRSKAATEEAEATEHLEAAEKIYREAATASRLPADKIEYGKFLVTYETKIAGATARAKSEFLEALGGDPRNPDNNDAWSEYMQLLEKEDAEAAGEIYAELSRSRPGWYHRDMYARFLETIPGKNGSPAKRIKSLQGTIELFKETYREYPGSGGYPERIGRIYEKLASETKDVGKKREYLTEALLYSRAALKIALENPDKQVGVDVEKVREKITELLVAAKEAEESTLSKQVPFEASPVRGGMTRGDSEKPRSRARGAGRDISFETSNPTRAIMPGYEAVFEDEYVSLVD